MSAKRQRDWNIWDTATVVWYVGIFAVLVTVLVAVSGTSC